LDDENQELKEDLDGESKPAEASIFKTVVAGGGCKEDSEAAEGPSMVPIHIVATAVITHDFEKCVENFINKHCKKLSNLPEAIEEAETERLGSMPPRQLQVSSSFCDECDKRGFKELHKDFQKLMLEGGFGEAESKVGRKSLHEACRITLELDNFVEAVSFDASAGMFQEQDKSIIVKLLLAASDYDTFISMLLELQMEQAWDGAHTGNDGAGMFVEGNFMTAESQNIYVNVMEKSAAGELAPQRPGLGPTVTGSRARGPGPA